MLRALSALLLLAAPALAAPALLPRAISLQLARVGPSQAPGSVRVGWTAALNSARSDDPEQAVAGAVTAALLASPLESLAPETRAGLAELVGAANLDGIEELRLRTVRTAELDDRAADGLFLLENALRPRGDLLAAVRGLAAGYDGALSAPESALGMLDSRHDAKLAVPRHARAAGSNSPWTVFKERFLPAKRTRSPDELRNDWYIRPHDRPATAREILRRLEDFGGKSSDWALDVLDRAAEAEPAFEKHLLRELSSRLQLRDLSVADDIDRLARIQITGEGPSLSAAALIRRTLARTAEGRRRMAGALLSAQPLVGGKLEQSSSRWADGAREALAKTGLEPLLPQLEPANVGLFLAKLSALRRLVPYHLANHSELSPLEWGDANGYAFPWTFDDGRRLLVYPVSESFRRFIFRGQDGETVEVKIPGEDGVHGSITPAHFTLSELLDAKAREQGRAPYTVRALHHAEYLGPGALYGRQKTFKEKAPLSLALFQYRDGKRLAHSVRSLPRLAERAGMTVERLRVSLDADVFEAAMEITNAGLTGYSHEGTDMHQENLRVVHRPGERPRAELVADFGSMTNKVEKMTMGQAQGWGLQMIMQRFSYDPSYRDGPKSYHRTADATREHLRAVAAELKRRASPWARFAAGWFEKLPLE